MTVFLGLIDAIGDCSDLVRLNMGTLTLCMIMMIAYVY